MNVKLQKKSDKATKTVTRIADFKDQVSECPKTELKVISKPTIETNKTVEDSLKSKDLIHLSHEIESPINDIAHFCQLSLQHLSSLPQSEHNTQKLRQFLTTIETNSKQLRSSLNNFKDLSKIEAGKENFNFERHDIYQLSLQVRNNFSEELLKKNITLTIPAPKTPAYAFCDKYKILQVISNLVDNAIKFSPNNKSIEILFNHSDIILGKRESDKEKTDGIIISISDQGLGIPDKELKHIFNNFLQSKKTKKGKGLNLSLSDEIISAHFGKIWAEHNPKGGAIFKMFLPDFKSNSH